MALTINFIYGFGLKIIKSFIFCKKYRLVHIYSTNSFLTKTRYCEKNTFIGVLPSYVQYVISKCY